MIFSFPKASIVIASYNNIKVLEQALDSMLKLDYPNDYEVIVVDDGSKDGTPSRIRQKYGNGKKIKLIAFDRNMGVCRARNAGIKEARFPIVVNMDHDCIPAKGWLKSLVSGFESKKVGVVSSFGSFGGTSTAFRKELLDKAGGYDEDYFYYREDTDLTFKIMDLGYEYRKVEAGYTHDHEEAVPKGISGWARYVLKRLRYHENDVLLYKKHPKLAKDFLHIKMGFMVDPLEDFKVVANLWDGSSKELKLGSPRGLELIKNKTPLHTLVIILLALTYVFAVKFFRLIGSIKFGKFLI